MLDWALLAQALRNFCFCLGLCRRKPRHMELEPLQPVIRARGWREEDEL